MDPSQMMPRSFPMWAPPPPTASGDPSAMPPPQPFLPPPNANLAPNRGWKRKNPNSGGGVGYQPPAIGDLQVQNRAKARRWFKNPNNPNQNHPNNNRKYFRKPKAAAPRNTTSFIIRAKRAGGIASLVSPCPVTPAVLPTPQLSPTREGLSDMAQAQWGVDGYGSMKGLIRLRRSPQNAASDDDDEGNSSGSDVEEHVEVERRLDHDLSRFEMVYPGRGEEDDEYDQDVHVARLEEENLTLKERLFLMEQEVCDMRRRLEALEARFSGTDAVSSGGGGAAENAVEEALANGMERGDAAADAGNAVGEALENDMEMGDAATTVEVALEDGTEKDEVESGNSGEDNAGRGDLGSVNIGEKDAESGAAGSVEDNGEEQA